MLSNERLTVATPDLIAENNYAGRYFGAPVDMLKSISQTNANFDNRGLAVSEYGGGARIGDHRQGLSVTDTRPIDPYGKLQPEEWQALVHEGNYAAICGLPFVWGSFLWLAFDTGGIPYDDGHYDGGNIKGLVTQDRKTRKDAYFFYQANWTTKPMLYLTSRRDMERTDPHTAIKVYSNAAAVTLTVNGKSYGLRKPDSQLSSTGKIYSSIRAPTMWKSPLQTACTLKRPGRPLQRERQNLEERVSEPFSRP